jgi:acyl carrier protein
MDRLDLAIAEMVGRVIGPSEQLSDLDADLPAAGLDSLKIIEFMLLMEERFQITVPEDMLEAETFRSIRHIAAMVRAVGGDKVMP